MKPGLTTLLLAITFCVAWGQRANRKDADLRSNNGDTLFNLTYSNLGLGSNRGSRQPTIQIKGTRLTYIIEQKKIQDKRKLVDTLLVTNVRTSSIDSIINIVEELNDTLIVEMNPCIMSGGTHILEIINNRHKTEFELQNTFHRTALKIIDIVNSYLPPDSKVAVSEQDIIDSEECWRKRTTKDPRK